MSNKTFAIWNEVWQTFFIGLIYITIYEIGVTLWAYKCVMMLKAKRFAKVYFRQVVCNGYSSGCSILSLCSH